jgi:hypothetical protein
MACCHEIDSRAAFTRMLRNKHQPPVNAGMKRKSAERRLDGTDKRSVPWFVVIAPKRFDRQLYALL